MKLNKKQRIALEFLAKVGPVACVTIKTLEVICSLDRRGMIRKAGGEFGYVYYISEKGREALKEATT